MNITQEFGNASYVIRGYLSNAVIVNGTSFTRSLIVMPQSLHADWEPQGLEDLKESHLEQVAALGPDLVLLGTGKRLQFPDRAVQIFFLQRNIGIEFMDTAAACRTYNILMAEGRNIACALLLG
jgi:uncharacterized protein